MGSKQEKTGLSSHRRRPRWYRMIEKADLDKSDKKGRSLLAQLIRRERKKAQKSEF